MTYVSDKVVAVAGINSAYKHNVREYKYQVCGVIFT